MTRVVAWGSGVGSSQWVLLAAGLAVFFGAVVAGTAAGDEAEPEPSYDMVVFATKADWQAIRYHRESGEAWVATSGDWRVIPEADGTKPPVGAYKVIASLYGENDWIALRLERKSGRSWRLGALKWIEMKVVEAPPKPIAPPEAE